MGPWLRRPGNRRDWSFFSTAVWLGLWFGDLSPLKISQNTSALQLFLNTVQYNVNTFHMNAYGVTETNDANSSSYSKRSRLPPVKYILLLETVWCQMLSTTRCIVVLLRHIFLRKPFE